MPSITHILKTPNQSAGATTTFHSYQQQKSQHKLAFKTQKQMSSYLKTTSPA